jgi:hypothetical protein
MAPDKTPHTAIAAKCTKRQIEVFEQIAIGNTTHPAKIINTLVKKGLVGLQEHKSKDGFGIFTWHEPFVPIDIHMQWCE